MSGLEFTAALVKSLAWPVAIMILAFIFRPSIHRALLQGIRRWKAGPGGIEVEYFETKVEELEQAVAREVFVAQEPINESDASLLNELEEVARISPSAAVGEAYSRVEGALREAAQTAGLDTARVVGRRLVDIARRGQLITEETASAVEGMAVLRNLAVHGGVADLDQRRAKEYLALADATLYAIRRSGK
jgi:hypothetical protein